MSLEEQVKGLFAENQVNNPVFEKIIVNFCKKIALDEQVYRNNWYIETANKVNSMLLKQLGVIDHERNLLKQQPLHNTTKKKDAGGKK